jgi:PAS domain-containing protein
LVLKDVSLNRQSGASAVSLAKSNPLTVGSSDHLDIEDRKHAELEREREFQEILDLTPQHLGVFGPDGSPLYANRVALDYFGVNSDQWRAESRIDLVHPDDREHFLGDRKTRFLEGADVTVGDFLAEFSMLMQTSPRDATY